MLRRQAMLVSLLVVLLSKVRLPWSAVVCRLPILLAARNGVCCKTMSNHRTSVLDFLGNPSQVEAVEAERK